MGILLKQIISRLLLNPVKSVLTILSISLGVMIISLVLNMNFKLDDILRDEEDVTVFYARNEVENHEYDESNMLLGSFDVITKLKNSIENVEDIIPIIPYGDNLFFYNKEKYKVNSAFQTTSGYTLYNNIKLIKGDNISDFSETRECIISMEVYESLLGDKSIKDEIISLKYIDEFEDGTTSISFKDIKIVGVFENSTPLEKERYSFPDIIYSIPRFEEGLYNSSTILLKVSPSTENPKVKILEGIKSIDGSLKDIKVWSGSPRNSDENQWYKSIVLLIKIVFTIFGIISLLISSFGVFSMITVSILDRNKEIGLKRALGGAKTDIIIQFLLEAVVIIVLGSIIGILLAMLFSPLFIMNVVPSITGGAIDMLVGVNLSLQPKAAFVAFLFSLVSGGLFGLFPSLSSAKSNPIDAIREN